MYPSLGATNFLLILYLLRHSQAEPQRGPNSSDEDRVLTIEGRAKLTRVLSIVRDNFHVEVDRILSSPYKRALETSEIAKDILKPRKPKIILGKELEPDKSPYELYSFVLKQKFVAQDRVLLVSHQPLLGDTISDLIELKSPSFAPASIARIDIGGEPRSGEGTLIWMLSSDVV